MLVAGERGLISDVEADGGSTGATGPGTPPASASAWTLAIRCSKVSVDGAGLPSSTSRVMLAGEGATGATGVSGAGDTGAGLSGAGPGRNPGGGDGSRWSSSAYRRLSYPPTGASGLMGNRPTIWPCLFKTTFMLVAWS